MSALRASSLPRVRVYVSGGGQLGFWPSGKVGYFAPGLFIRPCRSNYAVRPVPFVRRDDGSLVKPGESIAIAPCGADGDAGWHNVSPASVFGKLTQEAVASLGKIVTKNSLDKAGF